MIVCPVSSAAVRIQTIPGGDRAAHHLRLASRSCTKACSLLPARDRRATQPTCKVSPSRLDMAVVERFGGQRTRSARFEASTAAQVTRNGWSASSPPPFVPAQRRAAGGPIA